MRGWRRRRSATSTRMPRARSSTSWRRPRRCTWPRRARGGVPVSGTKGLYGHALGASRRDRGGDHGHGPRHGTAAGTCNLVNLDSGCDLNVLPSRGAAGWTPLSTSFGFGGMNAALVLRARLSTSVRGSVDHTRRATCPGFARRAGGGGAQGALGRGPEGRRGGWPGDGSSQGWGGMAVSELSRILDAIEEHRGSGAQWPGHDRRNHRLHLPPRRCSIVHPGGGRADRQHLRWLPGGRRGPHRPRGHARGRAAAGQLRPDGPTRMRSGATAWAATGRSRCSSSRPMVPWPPRMPCVTTAAC